MAIKITLQYFDGCPNWKQTEKELRQVVDNLHVDADISFEKIESHTDAEKIGFRGSPTILIGGAIPSPMPTRRLGSRVVCTERAKKPQGRPTPAGPS